MRGTTFASTCALASITSLFVTTTRAEAQSSSPPEDQPPAGVEPPPPAPTPPTTPPTPPTPATTPQEPVVKPAVASAAIKAPWYESFQVKGYLQLRHNRLPSLDTNDSVTNRQGDRSIGKGGDFSLRRARLAFSGDVAGLASFYIQPELVSSMSDQGGVAILRDCYADVFLDGARELRLRVGQSKVPYGYENLQSSSQRLPFDRADALNSAVRDERDLGLFVYWTPAKYKARFKQLAELKGAGDYGVVGVGVYNGQTANAPSDDTPHVVARVALPLQIGNQFVELGGGAYYGKYTLTLQPRTDQMYVIRGHEGETSAALVDTRAFASLVVAPQPLGFAAEYTVGRGPQQGRNTPSLIDSLWLHGGYAQLMYKIDRPLRMKAAIPFARGTYYDGGKKFFANAPHYVVKELELGTELQVHKAAEITVAYDITSRTSDSYPYRRESGHLTRVQLQINY